jgi:hypothetical protein
MEEGPTRGENAEDAWRYSAEGEAGSGWVTTEVAATALEVSPRTVRDYIQSGHIEAKAEGEGVTKRWLVSIDSVQALRSRRRGSGDMPRERRSGVARGDVAAEGMTDAAAAELLATVQELQYRLGRAEAKAELTERAESTIKEERDRLLEDLRRERERADALASAQEEAQRLREELEAERSKGFWRRLFGG